MSKKITPIPRKIFRKPEEERIAYIGEIISTFPNKNQFAASMSKDSLMIAATKSTLQSLGKKKKLQRQAIGEYRIYHTALATLICSQIDQIEGINIHSLRTSAITQFHNATERYHLETNKPYTNKLYDRVFTELLEGDILTVGEGSERRKKVYLHDPSPLSLVSLMYGKVLTHGTGISSWKRAYLSGFVTHHRGIDPCCIHEFSQQLHNEELIHKKDPDKFFSIHGVKGTGFVVLDLRGGWWRCYDRVSKPDAIVLENFSDKEREDISRSLQIISGMPFISKDTLSMMTSGLALNVINKIATHRANSLIINFTNCLVEARHAIALKMSQETIYDYDLLSKTSALWKTISHLIYKSDSFNATIEEIHNTLIKIAENQRITAKTPLEQGILEYLTKCSYIEEKPLYYELNTDTAGLYLRFLKYTGVRL